MLKEADEESNVLTFSCRLCSLFRWNLKRSCKIKESAYVLNSISNMTLLNQSQSSGTVTHQHSVNSQGVLWTSFTPIVRWFLSPDLPSDLVWKTRLRLGNAAGRRAGMAELPINALGWQGGRTRTWAHFSSRKLFSWGETQQAGMVTAPGKNARDERGVRKKKVAQS